MGATLPLDIIAAIARELCFHCQNPGHFPNADVEAVREDKRTLARLCRVSHDVSAVASPVLYHYHATGSYFVQNRIDRARLNVVRFARTLVARPQWAEHTVAIEFAPVIECPWGNSAEPLWPFQHFEKIENIRESYLAKFSGKLSRIVLYEWLYLLTSLCPRLQMVLLDLSHPKFTLGYTQCISFPSLRTLGVITAGEGLSKFELNWILDTMPNIEDVYVHASRTKVMCSRNFAAGSNHRAIPRAVPPMRAEAKRVTIVGMSPAQVQLLLPRARGAEYFECYNTMKPYSLRGVNFPADKVQLPSTLRALCLGCHPLIPEESDKQMSGNTVSLSWELRDLKPLEALEHLSVTCRSLARCIIKRTELDIASGLAAWRPLIPLAAILPRNLRTLKISWLDQNLREPLEALGEAVLAGAFPRLETVGIGISCRMVEERLKHILETMDAAPLFMRRGIKFGWTVDNIRPRMFEPGAPPRAGGFPLDEFPLNLEGPEWRLCEGDGPNVVQWSDVHDLWAITWDQA